MYWYTCWLALWVFVSFWLTWETILGFISSSERWIMESMIQVVRSFGKPEIGLPGPQAEQKHLNLIWMIYTAPKPMWNNLSQCETTSINEKQPEPMWNNLSQCETTWTHVKQPEPMWNNLSQCETTCANVKQPEPMWNNLSQCETTSKMLMAKGGTVQ